MTNLYAMMAEFDDERALLEAARQAFGHGYRKMDAYTPFPVEGLSEAIGFRSSRIALVVLIGGIIGCAGGYFLQYWGMVLSYPINVGNRPLNSWPAFIPVTFEMTILCAALAAVFGMLALNGLPMPYHPVFNVPQFALASQTRFFLSIEAKDPLFEAGTVRTFLKSTGAKEVYDVEP